MANTAHFIIGREQTFLHTGKGYPRVLPGPTILFLGPLLFLIYINDIVNNIHSNTKLFADDTSLYLIVDEPIDSARQLDSDLDSIRQWAERWLVTFNPAKSEFLLISRKLNRPRHPPLIMNNLSINEVSSYKHLGIFLSKMVHGTNT